MNACAYIINILFRTDLGLLQVLCDGVPKNHTTPKKEKVKKKINSPPSFSMSLCSLRHSSYSAQRFRQELPNLGGAMNATIFPCKKIHYYFKMLIR